MKSPLSMIVAILSAVIMLVVSFFTMIDPFHIRVTMLDWAAILIGIATLLGIINLITSHWKRLFTKDQKDYYSLILIITFFASAAAGLFFTPADSNYQKVITAIQVPVEVSLLAVLSVSLAFTAYRLLQRRKNIMGVVFVISFIVFLILGSGWLGNFQVIPLIGPLLTLLPLAGARGLLLGIGLASLTAGLRILFGADRPYSG